jgi:hypothetical protein
LWCCGALEAPDEIAGSYAVLAWIRIENRMTNFSLVGARACLEVAPDLAHEPVETIDKARRLWHSLPSAGLIERNRPIWTAAAAACIDGRVSLTDERG